MTEGNPLPGLILGVFSSFVESRRRCPSLKLGEPRGAGDALATCRAHADRTAARPAAPPGSGRPQPAAPAPARAGRLGAGSRQGLRQATQAPPLLRVCGTGSGVTRPWARPPSPRGQAWGALLSPWSVRRLSLLCPPGLAWPGAGPAAI